MPISTLNANDIREMCGQDAYSKGLAYKEAGAVTSLNWVDGVLEARVQGDSGHQYAVSISFVGDQPARAACTCPVGIECKHIAAAMLEYAATPGEVEETPNLATLLAPLDRSQIESLLLALIKHNSELYDDVVRQIYLAHAKSDTNVAIPLSTDRFRKSARAAFREARNMLNEYYDEMPDDAEARNLFFPLMRELEEVIKAGKANVALPALDAITGELAKAGWREDEEAYAAQDYWDDVHRSLGDVWLHAALSASLSREDRVELSDKLLQWSNDPSDAGLFKNAREALGHGWDDPVVLKMLATGTAGPEAAEWESTQVYDKRIIVLQEKGRTQEMLNLALAVENHLAAALAYLLQGQPVESASHAAAHLSKEPDILTVCEALQAAGATDAALRLGEYGLTQSNEHRYYDPSPRISTWVRDVAHDAGMTSLELRATERAYDEIPSLADYERIRVLSGDKWSERKESLLGRLFDPNTSADAAVDIFLREERWTEALSVAEGGSSYGGTLQRAIRATLQHIPDRAIIIAKRKAESIMNNAKASYYESAVQWLGYARAAHEAAGLLDEWKTYLRGLLVLHSRKYKLVPMLRTLA